MRSGRRSLRSPVFSEKSAARLIWEQKLSAYDEDSKLSIDTLLALPTCTGKIGSTGMCLGGHLAYRCALDPRVSATITYFATDLHIHSLSESGDDSLARAKDVKGELAMIHG